jgi:serine/threonine protein kinase/WD40 repeat protein
MTDPQTQRNPVEELAEAFLERYRRGERPALSEYIQQHPELADEIRELFPALVMMEEAGPLNSGTGRITAEGGPLERLGDYHILREVGRGGMGVVYEAEQESLGRHVALKVLPFEAAADPHRLQRFRREARSAARLHHTNIVPVHEVGAHQGVHYYAMQFIQGQGLDEVLRELRRLRLGRGPAPAGEKPAEGLAASLASGLVTGQFAAAEVAGAVAGPPDAAMSGAGAVARSGDPATTGSADRDAATSSARNNPSDFSAASGVPFYRSVARMGLQVAEALAYAHGQKVLHRDIKPANLLLDLQGTVWVTDFGLAKGEGDDLTQTGDLVGTLRYMAPERFNGVSDPRSDLYSLGLTLYELLTLQPAFEESDRGRLVKRVAHEEPPPPHKFDERVPRDLETIVLKATAKEPERRYQTAEALADDLRCFLADRPIRARRSAAWERAWRWCRRNPAVATLALLALLLLMAVASLSTIAAFWLKSERDHVQEAERKGRLELGRSLLAQGLANQRTGLGGQRFASIDLLGRAVDILRADPEGRDRLPEARDQLVSAFGLTDLAVRWERHVATGRGISIGCDAPLERYAVIDFRDGGVSVRRLDNDHELFHLPGPGVPFWHATADFTPNGRCLHLVYGLLKEAPVLLQVWHLGSKERVFSQRSRCWSSAIDPNGRWLVFAPPKGDGLSVWDLEQGREVKRLPLAFKPACLCPAPDGRRLAVSEVDTKSPQLKILDLESGHELASWDRQVGDNDNCMSWSADGRLLAIANLDSRVYVWDVPRGQLASVLQGHTAAVITCRFAHAGYLLATTSWDGTTRLWDAVSGEALTTAPGGDLGFSLADDQLAFFHEGCVGVWNVAHGRECRTLHPGMLGNRTEGVDHSWALHGADFSPDSRVLAIASSAGVSLYATETGQELAHLEVGVCGTVLFHPSGQGLITYSQQGLTHWPIRANGAGGATVWRIGPPRKLAGVSPEEEWWKAAWLPGSQALAVADRANKRVLVVDVAGPAPAAAPPVGLSSEHGRMTSIAVSPDGRWVAAGGWKDKGIQVWDLAKRRLERLLPHSDSHADTVFAVGFSPDGRWLISSSHTYDDKGGFYFWRVGTWERGPVLRRPSHVTGWGPPAFTRDGSLMAMSVSPHQIRLAGTATGREVIGHLPTVQPLVATPLAFSPDGTRLAAGTNQRTVLLWDLQAVRAQLAAKGLDWDLPAYPPRSPEEGRNALTVTIDLGQASTPLPHP